ncbi:hypothetical protein [Actinophytocola xinjiangensis]|uniref:hypothetical protein n=1 Tax=Actinophytocola xinjiangensis TaxID=485602 RepID=UPI0012B8A6DB|nr:hypothetical protein [Actinophytocola xinjiangensis]
MSVLPGERTVPRAALLARAWSLLGDGVAPLTNAAGRPLARTVKLILDPLVLRPVLNPGFAAGAVSGAHADDLVATITAAGPALRATAEWYLLVKRARRRAGITEGHPQDLYFQRCFELATTHGRPGADAERVAADVVEEVHAGASRLTAEDLRRYLTDPANAGELDRLLRAARHPVPDPARDPGPDPGVAAFLVSGDTAGFPALVAANAGSRGAAELAGPGVARGYGLSDRTVPVPPELGDRASKRDLPRPLDRSVLERLFTTVTGSDPAGLPALVRREIDRTGRAWQLGEEASRVTMVLGRDASAGLEHEPTSGAQRRLRSRWDREAYVHRVLRLPDPAAAGVPEALRADILGVRRAYLRRLWVRLHGREVRGGEVTADALWDLLDGVLRSVILDQRDRLRAALERLVAAR